MGDVSQVPALAGVHHLKLPVRDLDRSRAWYASWLGYRVTRRVRRGGQVDGAGARAPQ